MELPTLACWKRIRAVLFKVPFKWLSRAVSGSPSLVLLFWVLAVLAGVSWHLIIAFIRVSLTTYGVEHLLVRLVPICISPLVKWLLRSFAHLFI